MRSLNILNDNPENNDPSPLDSRTACIGTFDGMHLGHQELLLNAKKTGGGDYVAITFYELPQITLQSTDFKSITSNSQKEKLFTLFGASNLLYLDFTYIRDYSPNDFCILLNKKYNIQKIVIGEDFKFGKDRKGDASSLIDYFGLDNVIIVPSKLIDGQKVSSTNIREFLNKGDLTSVQKLLGRPYSFEAIVIKGDGIGKTLGFPTANLAINKHIVPKNGVYSVKVSIEGFQGPLNGMMNIGYRPTVSTKDELRIEVNIFDFDTDIYGKNLSINIISLLREEKRFTTVDELKTQLLRDKESSIKKLKS